MKRERTGVILKSSKEIALMREVNIHVAEILNLMCEAAVAGTSTWDLDQIARAEIARRKVKSAFLGYHGFPGTVCVSVNEEIVHGIPRRDKVLKDGDIIGIDFGLVHQGYVGDSARTVAVGTVDATKAQLLAVTAECLQRAIAMCQVGNRLSDIGRVVQTHAEENGFSVVRDFVGHGIGTRLHEEPQVLNYYDGPKPRMEAGLVIAIEPMINAGTHEVEVLKDGWTAVTRDRKPSAHFEHSVALTHEGPMVLSLLP